MASCVFHSNMHTNTRLMVYGYAKLTLAIRVDVAHRSVKWNYCLTLAKEQPHLVSIITGLTSPMETRWGCLSNNSPTTNFDEQRQISTCTLLLHLIARTKFSDFRYHRFSEYSFQRFRKPHFVYGTNIHYYVLPLGSLVSPGSP